MTLVCSKGSKLPQIIIINIIIPAIIIINIINIITISTTTTTLVVLFFPLLLAKYFGDGKQQQAPTLMTASARLLSASCLML